MPEKPDDETVDDVLQDIYEDILDWCIFRED